MKLSSINLLAYFSLVHAHYAFTELSYKGVDYSHWRFVRRWGDPKHFYSKDHDDYTPWPYQGVPAEDGIELPSPNMGLVVNTTEMRCNNNATFANETLVVQAGDELGFYVDYKPTDVVAPAAYTMYHPGPLSIYLGRVPEGKTAQNWKGEGKTWFKIYHDFPDTRPPPSYDNSNRTWPKWPNTNRNNMSILIPPSTPSGEYLFRIEQIQLDFGPQFYISCAQIRIENGGNGVPGPLVSIPGYYDPDDEIWKTYTRMYNITAPVNPWEIRNPGPPVWTG